MNLLYYCASQLLQIVCYFLQAKAAPCPVTKSMRYLKNKPNKTQMKVKTLNDINKQKQQGHRRQRASGGRPRKRAGVIEALLFQLELKDRVHTGTMAVAPGTACRPVHTPTHSKPAFSFSVCTHGSAFTKRSPSLKISFKTTVF